jgi:flagellar hook-associated protein 2
MAVDYLSALNAGSGLNTTQIVDALVEASRAPKAEAINKKVEENNVKISGFGTLKQQFETFKTSMTSLDGEIGLSVASGSSNIETTITDKTKISDFSHSMAVSQLAQNHTLVFANNFSTENASIGQGTLLFEFGSWNRSNSTFAEDTSITNKTLTINSTNNTLTGLRDAINDGGMGLTASIIQTATSAYSLVVKSNSGSGNEMKITATEDSSNAGLSTFGFSTYASSKETIIGQDANLTIDGVTVTRSSNTITDLINGVQLEIKGTVSSAVTVNASYDETNALANMNSFVTSLNTLNTKLSELTNRGLNGEASGALAGDSIARSIQSRIRSMTTTPIEGYSTSSIYLTNFGISTQLDGSIAFDEDEFLTAYRANPEDIAAIFASQVKTDSSSVTAQVTGDDYVAGVYDFALSSGSATISSSTMISSSGNYYTLSGNTAGLTVSTGLSTTTNSIFLGRSLLDTLSTYADTILSSSGTVNSQINSKNDDITDLNQDLADLDTKMVELKDRYVLQFSQMERAVKSLRDTGDYIKNFTDSMRAAREN